MAIYEIAVKKSAVKELGDVPKKELKKIKKKYKTYLLIQDHRAHRNYHIENNIG